MRKVIRSNLHRNLDGHCCVWPFASLADVFCTPWVDVIGILVQRCLCGKIDVGDEKNSAPFDSNGYACTVRRPSSGGVAALLNLAAVLFSMHQLALRVFSDGDAVVRVFFPSHATLQSIGRSE